MTQKDKKQESTPSIFFKVVQWFLFALSMPVEVVCRHHHGVRYVDLKKILGALGAQLAIATFALGFMPIESAVSSSRPMYIFTVITTVIALYHYVVARRAEIQGRRWNTRYVGDSYLGFIGVDLARRVVEPVIAIVAGAMLFVTPIGFTLFFGGWATLIKINLIYEEELNRERDAFDAQDIGRVLASSFRPHDGGYSRS